MAHRRMISQEIVDTDAFAELPLSTRYLYYELIIRADDDGFVGAPMRIVRMVGCAKTDLEELIDGGYVIKFESGIIVIRDWKVHNTVRKDIYQKTRYQNEFDMLYESDKRYYLKRECDVTKNVTQDVTCNGSLSKDKKGKVREVKDNLFTSLTLKGEESHTPHADAGGVLPPFTFTECQECAAKGKVNLTDDGIQAFYSRMEKDGWKIKGTPIINLLLAMRGFAKNYGKHQKTPTESKSESKPVSQQKKKCSKRNDKDKMEESIYEVARYYISEQLFSENEGGHHCLIQDYCPKEEFTEEQLEYMHSEWYVYPKLEKYVKTDKYLEED